jgi:hypothetical protein
MSVVIIPQSVTALSVSDRWRVHPKHFLSSVPQVFKPHLTFVVIWFGHGLLIESHEATKNIHVRSPESSSKIMW